jgi:hypothetical protein
MVLVMSITVNELKAKILATKKTGALTETIKNHMFSLTELTKLYTELPDRKIRRWFRNRKPRERSLKHERNLSLPL